VDSKEIQRLCSFKRTNCSYFCRGLSYKGFVWCVVTEKKKKRGEKGGNGCHPTLAALSQQITPNSKHFARNWLKAKVQRGNMFEGYFY